MKRIIATLLILSLTLLCGIPALAEDTTPKRELLTSGDWEYYLLEDGGAELLAYIGPAGDIVIPNDLDGHPITAVRENPFQLLYDDFTVTVSQDHPYLATIDGVLFGKTDRSLICHPRSLTAVSYEIPEGIRRIGDYAFCGCSDLTAVTIPDSVTSIGDFAFAFCFDLTSVTIPNSVMSIGKDAFHSCSGLTSVTILDGVTSIGGLAFAYCSGLTNVTIPDSVTSIGEGAFASCSGLVGFNLSSGNKAYAVVDGALFTTAMDILVCYPAGSTNDNYTIPDSVTSIGDYAFGGCRRLTSVTIPDSVTSIGDAAFFFCSSLTSVMIPDSVTSIGQYAFSSCSGLTAVTIPDSVTSISNSAFYGCSNLAAVTIPDSVTSIGNEAFDRCDNLTLSVIAGSYAEQYCIQNNLRYTVIAPDLQDAPTDGLTGDP